MTRAESLICTLAPVMRVESAPTTLPCTTDCARADVATSTSISATAGRNMLVGLDCYALTKPVIGRNRDGQPSTYRNFPGQSFCGCALRDFPLTPRENVCADVGELPKNVGIPERRHHCRLTRCDRVDRIGQDGVDHQIAFAGR